MPSHPGGASPEAGTDPGGPAAEAGVGLPRADSGAAGSAESGRGRPSWIPLAAAILLAFLGYGAGHAMQRTGFVPGPGKLDVEAYRREIRERVERPALTNLQRICARNFMVFSVLCLGIGTAGILTTLQIFWLGASVGIDVAHALTAGVDGRIIFWFTFPHGVPEVASFCLAASVGLHGTLIFGRYLRGGPLLQPGEVPWLLRRAVLGLALLAVAGLVEVFVTPALGVRYL